MKSKKKPLPLSRLYVVLDKEVSKPKPLLRLAQIIRDSQADLVQYRDKKSAKDTVLRNALSLNKIFANSKTHFIINDYLDIAKIANSDGIHLGQQDVSVRVARRILGKDKIIGVSCHTLKQAQEAQRQGADYISLGPIFPTLTKPESKAVGLNLISQVSRKIRIPFFVIGGIKANNLMQVTCRGAKRIAVARAVCKAGNPAGAIVKLKQQLH